MKKKVGMILLALAMATMIMAGCGKKVEENIPYNYDLGEYVKIADYHNLPFVNLVAEVTDEDVENEIKSILEYAATVENSTTGVVEDGDTINIAFAGRIDGELFDGGSSESYDLTVGTTSMIDGFVEGLIGQSVGDTVTLDLQFPEDYHSAEVAGKPVVFDVTINSKRIVTTPEFNDEFVQANTDFQTTEEYRNNLKENLTKQSQQSLDAEVKDALWEVIVTGSEALQYPEEEMAAANAMTDDMEAEYKTQATLYGLEWEDFLALFMSTDEEGFAQMKDEYAKYSVLSDMVLYKMARDEGLSVTQSEFEERTREILSGSNFTEESFQASYGMTIFEYAEENGWKKSFLIEKLMDKVMEYGHEVSEEEFTEYVNDTLGYEEETVLEEETEQEETTEAESGTEKPESDDGAETNAETGEEAEPETNAEASEEAPGNTAGEEAPENTAGEEAPENTEGEESGSDGN